MDASISSALKFSGLLIMGAEHEQPQHLQIVFLSDLTNGKEIAREIRTSFRLSMFRNAIVQPVSCKGPFHCSTRSVRSRSRGEGKSGPPRRHGCQSPVSPRYFLAITEHSICQPGRPSHQGARRPGRLAFFFLWLPENEIQWVFLLVFTGSPRENVYPER